jgi:hypothetical protein
MEKQRKISFICLLIALLLFAVPIPRKSEKEGTTRLSSIIPIYEICTYDYVDEIPLHPGIQNDTSPKQGVEVRFCGIPVYQRTYFTNVEQ